MHDGKEGVAMAEIDFGEPPGYDDRKILADVWQNHGGTAPDGLSDIYDALIAVAHYGWLMAKEAYESCL